MSSKEQTPIENIQDIINNQFLTREEKLSEIVKNVKVYTNIKVLEALERDLKDLRKCYNAHFKDNPKKEVCAVLRVLIQEKEEQLKKIGTKIR